MREWRVGNENKTRFWVNTYKGNESYTCRFPREFQIIEH